MAGIPDRVIEDTVVELLRLAVTKLPADVEAVLRRIFEEETAPASQMQMKAILENLKLAEQTNTPLCQDTGIRQARGGMRRPRAHHPQGRRTGHE
jgi:tartrate dehydratase alpha subunit/fumarate hydratase class I-like protein